MKDMVPLLNIYIQGGHVQLFELYTTSLQGYPLHSLKCEQCLLGAVQGGSLAKHGYIIYIFTDK